MSRDLVVYVLFFLVMVVSFVAAKLLPVPDEFKGVITLPGIVSLLSVIVQAWRDIRAYERTLEIQERQQEFTLGIASHMAKVIFDRQVEFSEQYFESAHEALLTLYVEGPCEEVIKHAKTLRRIRIKYSPWVSEEIEKGFMPFEKALRDIGVDAKRIEGMPVGPKRTAYVDRMFDTFSKVTSVKKPEPGQDPEETVSYILNHLRRILGIAQFMTFRDRAIQAAFERTSAFADQE